MNKLILNSIILFFLGEEAAPEAVNTEAEAPEGNSEERVDNPNVNEGSEQNEENDYKQSQILEAVRLDPSLREDPEIKLFLESYEASQKAKPAVKPVEKKVEGTEPVVGDEKNKVNDIDDDSDDDILNSKKVKGEKEKFEKITPETLIDFAKEDGIDTSKDNWLPTLLEQYSTGKASIKKAEELQAVIDEYGATLKSLPSPLLRALQEFEAGNDWRSAIQTNDIDYSGDFESLTTAQKVSMINNDFPEDTIEEKEYDEKDPAIKRMIAVAKKSFESKKTEISSIGEKNKEKAAEENKKFLSSVKDSSDNFKKKYPHVDPDKLKAVESIVANGIHKYYFDDKSKVKENAIEKAFFAEFGESMLESAKKKAKKDGSSEKAAELLSTTSSSGGNSNQQQQRQYSDFEKGLIEQDKRLSEASKSPY